MDRKEIEQERTVSVYQYKPGSSLSYLTTFDSGDEVYGDFVRVSEPLMLRFKARDRGEMAAAQVAAIDSQIETLRDAFEFKLGELRVARQNLLALTAPDSDE